MAYECVPFGPPEELTDEIFDRVRALLAELEGKKTVLHCGSANRVGGVWAAYRVLDQGVELETAIAEGREVGLRNEGYEARLRESVAQRTLRELGRRFSGHRPPPHDPPTSSPGGCGAR